MGQFGHRTGEDPTNVLTIALNGNAETARHAVSGAPEPAQTDRLATHPVGVIIDDRSQGNDPSALVHRHSPKNVDP